MQRINLGKPYDDFYPKSDRCRIFQDSYWGHRRDSLRDKYEAQAEDNRITHIKALLEEAELNLKVDGPIEIPSW